MSRYFLDKGGRNKLDDCIKISLLLLRDRVLCAPPVKLGKPLSETWIVFTDGACNPERHEGSVGGLLVSPCGICTSFFSAAVPADVLKEFFHVSKNPIHELEVLPVLIACMEWGRLFSGSLVVYYVDNESARMAFVKGAGETPFASRMIHDFVCLESEMGHRVWFGRCPSYSNPSDSASRLDTVWFREKGVSQTVLDWERLRHHLGLDGVASDRR